eukprot:3695051-Rhodomonas_salina.1
MQSIEAKHRRKAAGSGPWTADTRPWPRQVSPDTAPGCGPSIPCSAPSPAPQSAAAGSESSPASTAASAAARSRCTATNPTTVSLLERFRLTARDAVARHITKAAVTLEEVPLHRPACSIARPRRCRGTARTRARCSRAPGPG